MKVIPLDRKLLGVIGLMISIGLGNLEAVTLVYNLRVRRTFTAPAILKLLKNRVLLTGLPIFFDRSSHIVNDLTKVDVYEKRRAGGSLFNVRYVPNKHWWLDVTTGLETD